MCLFTYDESLCSNSSTPKADYKNRLVKDSDFGNAEVLLAEQARLSGSDHCTDAGAEGWTCGCEADAMLTTPLSLSASQNQKYLLLLFQDEEMANSAVQCLSFSGTVYTEITHMVFLPTCFKYP